MSDYHYQYSLCNVPSWVIGSREFNADPTPLTVLGVRESHAHFFKQLDALSTWEDRARIFRDYMEVAFHLHQWREKGDDGRMLSIKHSYLRFLRGWLFESDSIEGAVLKGWVQTRMGLPPIYHNGRIKGKDSDEYLSYMKDRMKGSAQTNGIFNQLDLLFEFVQYELNRRDPERTHITLFRGVHGFYDHELLEWDKKTGKGVLRLNNLNSFTHDFERAWEFGTFVIEVQVPVAKIFFDGDFLHAGILRGEKEVLVIGGVYDISRRII
nr:NAD(+)--dinitrogen-reductase ADP-D-ribosyltransferase [uncultured Desulfobacter sp.]